MSRVQFPEQPHKVWQPRASDDAVSRGELALGTEGNAHAWFAKVIGNGVIVKRNDVGLSGSSLEGWGAFAAGHAACGKCADVGKATTVGGLVGVGSNRTQLQETSSQRMQVLHRKADPPSSEHRIMIPVIDVGGETDGHFMLRCSPIGISFHCPITRRMGAGRDGTGANPASSAEAFWLSFLLSGSAWFS
jgi:hypothetical protein